MIEEIWVIDGEQFTSNTLVSANYVGKKPYGVAYGDLKVYIPSLMPTISMGVAKALSPVSINKSIFCNSSECQITPMSKVTPQNFVTAKSYFHTEFQLPHIDYGSAMVVRGDDHDFQSVSITTNEDHSVYHED